jgi:hypothetical protein
VIREHAFDGFNLHIMQLIGIKDGSSRFIARELRGVLHLAPAPIGLAGLELNQ